MSEDDSAPASAAPSPAPDGETPTKKKTSVKVVRRVKSKKSEKGERPELAPPPATISESPAAPDQEQENKEPPKPARIVPNDEPVRRPSSKKRVASTLR